MTRETVKKFVFPLLFPYWYQYQVPGLVPVPGTFGIHSGSDVKKTAKFFEVSFLNFHHIFC